MALLQRPSETTMIWAVSAQAIMVSVGYLAAGISAGTFAAIAAIKLGGHTTGDVLELGHFLVLCTAMSLTALVAGFWPAAVAVALTEGLKLRGLVAHVMAGCAVGLLAALPVRAFVSGAPLPEIETAVVQLSIASGAIGGFVYWLIAGRTAGKWLSFPLFELNRR